MPIPTYALYFKYGVPVIAQIRQKLIENTGVNIDYNTQYRYFINPQDTEEAVFVGFNGENEVELVTTNGQTPFLETLVQALLDLGGRNILSNIEDGSAVESYLRDSFMKLMKENEFPFTSYSLN